MATRATYQFIEDGVNVTFYCHWDGYPMGAAERIRIAQATKTAHPNYRLCDQFARFVDDAEHTESHAAHGDTEYRYTIESHTTRFRAPGDYTIRVEHHARVYQADQWCIEYEGALEPWLVNQAALLAKAEERAKGGAA